MPNPSPFVVSTPIRECRLWSMRPCLGLSSSSSISTGCPYQAIQRHIASSFRGRRASRSGVVRALVLALVLFIILAPSGSLSLAIGLGIETAALVVAIATARQRRAVRRRRALVAGGAAVVAVLGVAAGVVPGSVVVAL